MDNIYQRSTQTSEVSKPITMIVEIIDSNSIDFPPGSEYDFSDFIVWVHEKMLPDHIVFVAFGKYWRVSRGKVYREYERYSAEEFALYRERLGMTDENETKGKVLNYINEHEDVRYSAMSAYIGVSNASVGYHIADLKARELVETDPLALTEIGELALAYLSI